MLPDVYLAPEMEVNGALDIWRDTAESSWLLVLKSDVHLGKAIREHMYIGAIPDVEARI